jgi:chemotaxis protein MotB
MIHMPKQIWIFAGILTALFLGAVGFLQVREATRERATALSAAAAATALAEAHSRTNSLLAAELEHLRAQAAELEKQVQQAAADRSSLETQMRSELESRDITISELQGKLTINILDRVLFDSGEAELKPEGQQVLLKLAQILQQHTNRQVQVIGHTDNVPIHSRTRGGFTDNWSLSAGRATAAVRFLHALRVGVSNAYGDIIGRLICVADPIWDADRWCLVVVAFALGYFDCVAHAFGWPR